MGDFIFDIRHALRTLRRDLPFTVTAAATLGLGIGLVTGFFAIVHAVLLTPLAAHGETVVRVWKRDTSGNVGRFPLTYPELALWREGAGAVHSLAAISYYDTAKAAVLMGTDPIPVTVAPVSADFFKVMHGGAPLVGRWFTAADEGNTSEVAAVASERFWRRVSGGDPALIGRPLRWPGGTRAIVIVGIAPPDLDYPHGTDLWVPIDGYFKPEPGLAGLDVHSRRLANFHFLARLRAGASVERATAELDTLSRGVAARFPDDYRVMPVVVEPLLHASLGTLRPLTLFLFAGAALLFLAAGGNVAALLVMRSAGQARDVAVRVALGAGRLRIARQIVTEAFLVGAAGAVCGVGVAYGCVRIAQSAAAAEVPRLANAAVNRTGLAFCVAVTLGWVMTLGTMPLWRRRRTVPALTQELATGATRSGSALRVMIVVQVTAAVVIATAAGLLIRSFVRLHAVERGFDGRNLAVLTLQLPDALYPSPAARETFYARLLPTLSALPGVASATTVHLGPGTGQTGLSARMTFEGQEPERARDNPYATWEPVMPTYFDTLGIPIVQGRPFLESDNRESAPVAIVSESIVRRYWPGENPVGRRLRFTPQSEWTTVVGVAADTRYRELTRDWLTVYFPARQFFFFAPSALVVRTASADVTSLLTDVRRTIQGAGPGVTVHSTDTMEQLLADEMARPRTAMLVATLFALMAIIVASIGVCAVFGYEVARRARELAIRSAVGATPRQIFVATLRASSVLGVTGAAIGLVTASVLTGFLQSVLFEIPPLDVTSFVAAGMGLLTIVVLASALPASRAARVDPARLLRTD